MELLSDSTNPIWSFPFTPEDWAQTPLAVQAYVHIRNRSGCQNRTLVITSSDGVPCAYGYAPLIATGTLGTDSA